MVELLVLHVVRLYGMPRKIVSDRRPQFSPLWRAFCQGLGSSTSLFFGYDLQMNGQMERANQDLGAALQCMTSCNRGLSSKLLPCVEYSYNSMTSLATGMSPFKCSLGYQPPLFPDQDQETSVPFVHAHLLRCQRIRKWARSALRRTISRTQRLANLHLGLRPQTVGQFHRYRLSLL